MAVHGKNNKAKTIEVSTILTAAYKALEGVAQWRAEGETHLASNVEWLAYANQYAAQAQALIELVEVHLCGSTGGFAVGQPEWTRRSLSTRLGYLYTVFKEEWPGDIF